MRAPVKTTIKAFALTAAVMLLTAPAAFASTNGQGWWGETDDKVTTAFGLGLVVLFPLIVVIGSIIQGRMEKAADERKKNIFKK